MASAFARVSPATTSRRRIANGRINIVDQLETTGAFDASSGFNGSLLAYSGTNTTYTQGPGYGCGALTMLIDLTDEQIFGLLEKIS